MNPNVIVVVGPTASGKSDFAVELAYKVNGEIISCDSRQVYKGLDIGTGKITKEEMKGVPHYMLSVYDCGEEISVTRFSNDALPILEDIKKRGKTTILCGGTGQYIDALMYKDFLPEVPPNKILRVTLEQKPTEELYKEIEKKDPTRAKNIDKHNRVRLIRALEILDSLPSVPILPTPTFRHETTLYIMNISRDSLRKRITRRLENRLKQGMIEEVKNILNKGDTNEKVLKKYGIEYYVIARYIRGEIEEEKMKEEIITKSMQYAKRQQTWNKKYLPFAKLIEVEV